jgi:hypothetical protein
MSFRALTTMAFGTASSHLPGTSSTFSKLISIDCLRMNVVAKIVWSSATNTARRGGLPCRNAWTGSYEAMMTKRDGYHIRVR